MGKNVVFLRLSNPVLVVKQSQNLEFSGVTSEAVLLVLSITSFVILGKSVSEYLCWLLSESGL